MSCFPRETLILEKPGLVTDKWFANCAVGFGVTEQPQGILDVQGKSCKELIQIRACVNWGLRLPPPQGSLDSIPVPFRTEARNPVCAHKGCD